MWSLSFFLSVTGWMLEFRWRNLTCKPACVCLPKQLLAVRGKHLLRNVAGTRPQWWWRDKDAGRNGREGDEDGRSLANRVFLSFPVPSQRRLGSSVYYCRVWGRVCVYVCVCTVWWWWWRWLNGGGGGGWWRRTGREGGGRWKGGQERRGREVCVRRTLAASLSPAPHTHTHHRPTLTSTSPSYFSYKITRVDLPTSVTSPRLE